MTLSLRYMGNKFRKFGLKSNTLILVKSGTALTVDGNLERMIDVLGKTGLDNIVVIVVDDLDDVKAIPEEVMNKHGWYRAEGLRNLVLRKKE